MTYPNERIPEFVRHLEEHPETDQVVGARTTEEGTYKLLRVPAKWVIRKLAEKLTSAPRSPTSTRACGRSAARCRCPTCGCCRPGFSCVTTITLSFLSNQHPVDYLPIDYAKRAGTSKFHFVRDAYRYILQVLRMVMYFNPIKVLMPLGADAAGARRRQGHSCDVVRYDFRVTTNTVLLFVTGLIIASMALLADLIVRSRGDT